MRYLLCTVLILTACERRDTARDTQVADTAAAVDSAPARAMSAVPDRLLGEWTASGYDAGSTRAQRFLMTWNRAPDGGLTGTISFPQGATYKVKVVSTTDSTITYESDPHHSPTLKAEVVTRSEARLVGDSLMGTYEAKATKGGKVLRGRFTAKRGSTS
jgi:hypothetical protein